MGVVYIRVSVVGVVSVAGVVYIRVSIVGVVLCCAGVVSCCAGVVLYCMYASVLWVLRIMYGGMSAFWVLCGINLMPWMLRAL